MISVSYHFCFALCKMMLTCSVGSSDELGCGENNLSHFLFVF